MSNGYAAIIIDGKTFGFKFNSYTMELIILKVAKYPGVLLDEVFNIKPMGVAFVLYAGYKSNCVTKNIKPEYEYDFFIEYMEKMADDSTICESIKKILHVWEQSAAVQELIISQQNKA